MLLKEYNSPSTPKKATTAPVEAIREADTITPIADSKKRKYEELAVEQGGKGTPQKSLANFLSSSVLQPGKALLSPSLISPTQTIKKSKYDADKQTGAMKGKSVIAKQIKYMVIYSGSFVQPVGAKYNQTPDCINYYVSSPIFQILMMDKSLAPKVHKYNEGGVKGVASEYLSGFQDFNLNYPKVKPADFEEGWGALTFIGDSDPNWGNLGTVELNGERYLAKVDHGRAFTQTATSPEILVDIMLGSMKQRYPGFWKEIKLEKIKSYFEKISAYDLNKLLSVIDTRCNSLDMNAPFTLTIYNFKHANSESYIDYRIYEHAESVNIQNKSQYAEYAKGFIQKHYSYLDGIVKRLDHHIKTSTYQQVVQDRFLENATTILI